MVLLVIGVLYAGQRGVARFPEESGAASLEEVDATKMKLADLLT